MPRLGLVQPANELTTTAASSNCKGAVEMTHLTKPEYQERSKIEIDDARQAKSWAHTLGVTRDELRRVIGKVGNSASLVRREIDRLRLDAGKLCEDQASDTKPAKRVGS